MRRVLQIICASILLNAAVSTVSHADSGQPSEYQVKAAFIYQFTKYVKWPGAMSLGSINHMNICLWGSNPFGEAVSIFDKASTASLKIAVIKNASSSDLSKCHMLFVSKSSESEVAAVLSEAGRYPILTISEISGFANKGGMIEMQTTEKNIGVFSRNSIGLVINTKSAQKLDIKVDAQLLEIAKSVIR